jgi:hypothetical protein
MDTRCCEPDPMLFTFYLSLYNDLQAPNALFRDGQVGKIIQFEVGVCDIDFNGLASKYQEFSDVNGIQP